jgi:hypothetical protein
MRSTAPVVRDSSVHDPCRAPTRNSRIWNGFGLSRHQRPRHVSGSKPIGNAHWLTPRAPLASTTISGHNSFLPTEIGQLTGLQAFQLRRSRQWTVADRARFAFSAHGIVRRTEGAPICTTHPTSNSSISDTKFDSTLPTELGMWTKLAVVVSRLRARPLRLTIASSRLDSPGSIHGSIPSHFAFWTALTLLFVSADVDTNCSLTSPRPHTGTSATLKLHRHCLANLANCRHFRCCRSSTHQLLAPFRVESSARLGCDGCTRRYQHHIHVAQTHAAHSIWKTRRTPAPFRSHSSTAAPTWTASMWCLISCADLCRRILA